MQAPTDAGSYGAPLPPPPVPPGGRPGPRQLRRRPDDGHIGGVCAGVAEYFNVDPVIVRIAAVVLAFSGPGVIAYVLAWIFVPEAHGPIPFGAPQAPIDRKDRGTQIFGIVLLAIAISVLWGDWWSPARHVIFPLGLMALGAWLLLRRDGDDDADVVGASPVPPTPSSPSPPTTPWGAGGTVTDTTTVATLGEPTTRIEEEAGDPSASSDDAVTDTLVADAGGGEPPRAPWDVPPLPTPPVPPVPPVPTVVARRRRIVGPIVFGALLLWAGLAFLLGVSVESGLAGGLLIIGVGFVLGSFVGGSHVLILPALVVGAALAATAVLDIPLRGPIGEQQWVPQRLTDVDDRYEVSIGEGILDLTALDVPAGTDLEIAASVGVGHLVIVVPDGTAVSVTTEVGAGESKVLDIEQNGVGVTTDQHDDGLDSRGTITLDLEVGLGQVEVTRVDVTEARDPELPVG